MTNDGPINNPTKTNEYPVLTERMRTATISDHEKSNQLVNLKLALVVTSPPLYGEAVWLFVPIFAKMEQILKESKHPELMKFQPLLNALCREPGLRKDVAYYLTSDRQQELEQVASQYQHSKNAWTEYLNRLDWIQANDPILMIAYVYHSYSGILAGGRILKRIVKKAMGLKKDRDDGVETFSLQDMNSKQMLTKLKHIINEEIYITEEEEIRVINEGRELFRLNDQLVNTIQATPAWKKASKQCFQWTVLSLVGASVVLASSLCWAILGKTTINR